jgi:hypothetical protein
MPIGEECKPFTKKATDPSFWGSLQKFQSQLYPTAKAEGLRFQIS